jgi:hypothetical protein
MLADLPRATQERLVRRIAVHLERTPFGGGAMRSALTDVIEDALRQDS